MIYHGAEKTSGFILRMNKHKRLNNNQNESQNINKEKKPGVHCGAPQGSSLCDQQKEPEIQTASEKLISVTD